MEEGSLERKISILGTEYANSIDEREEERDEVEREEERKREVGRGSGKWDSSI